MTLQKLLGIELPIIQAPMAGVQGSALAIAVSNAGALGSLPCAMLNLAAIRTELATIKANTNKPFNVNFFCHTPPMPSAEREAAWRATLTPYYKEYGIDADTIPAGPGRAPFSSEAADVLDKFKPPVVSFHFGLPSPQLLARVRAWGSKILSSATTVEEARWLEAQGADAIMWCNLKDGVKDVELADAVKKYFEHLKEQGQVHGYRITRRKLGLGPAYLPEFHIMLDFMDMAQMDAAFNNVSSRSDPVESFHHAVNSKVCDLFFALYRDFPDENRVRG